ncbi:hypothetical protein BH23PAT1_BH23PAT1_3990 [soil metagenome]
MSGILHSIRNSAYKGVIEALLVSNGVSLFLFAARVAGGASTRFWFLIWNLILAWLPLLFAWLLVKRLKTNRWRQPMSIFLGVLWLGFLPNSFYLVSDLIHLHVTGEVNVLYDAVMFTSFIFNGYVAGFMSLYLVHGALLKRFSYHAVNLIVGGVLLACSYAIYLGRVLRWNTWDVLVNPAGVLFDLSEQVVNPISHPQLFMTTVTFFLLLSSMYFVIWRLIRALRAK